MEHSPLRFMFDQSILFTSKKDCTIVYRLCKESSSSCESYRNAVFSFGSSWRWALPLKPWWLALGSGRSNRCISFTGCIDFSKLSRISTFSVSTLISHRLRWPRTSAMMCDCSFWGLSPPQGSYPAASHDEDHDFGNSVHSLKNHGSPHRIG